VQDNVAEMQAILEKTQLYRPQNTGASQNNDVKIIRFPTKNQLYGKLA
jgi:hypothetical protein